MGKRLGGFIDVTTSGGGGTPDDNSVTTAKIADGAVTTVKVADANITPRKLSALARNGGWLPSGGIDQTTPERLAPSAVGLALTSGTLYVVGGVVLAAGQQVNSISFMSNGALSGLSNQWACLVDTSRNVLAKSTDDTSNAWGSGTVKTFPISGGYTPSNDTEVWLGLCIVASGMGSHKSFTTNAAVNGIAPIYSGNSTTGLTNPASLGGTITAPTAGTDRLWAYIS